MRIVILPSALDDLPTDAIFTSSKAKDWAITSLNLFCRMLIHCGFKPGFT
jgi:hypothetical protein